MTSRAPAAERALTVAVAESGSRLDRLLAERLGVTRSRIRTWIDGGRVSVDGRVAAKAGDALRAGQRICWEPPPAIDGRVLPEPGELRILLEDPCFVVLDKPADLVVHPGAGRPLGTLAHRIVARYPETVGVGGPGRPGIVHRLDRGTSGAIVVARDAEAHAALARAFASRNVDKRYLAIVWGHPRVRSGRIEEPIGRHPTQRQRMAVRANGRPARTDWHLVAESERLSLLELELHTGRTHQIRVHCRAFGHPLVGDPVYGDPTRARHLPRAEREAIEVLARPALHAWKLAFPHPRTGERVAVIAPLPQDLVALWTHLSGMPFPHLA